MIFENPKHRIKDVADFVEKSHARVATCIQAARLAHRVSEDELCGGDGDEEDTWIFPSVQLGPLGLRQDSQITEQLLRSGQPGRRPWRINLEIG